MNSNGKKIIILFVMLIMLVSVAKLKNTVNFITIPVIDMMNSIVKIVKTPFVEFKTSNELAKENKILKLENDKLKTINNKLLKNQAELSTLKKLYELDKSYDEYEKVGANVITKDITNWNKIVIIDKGRKDGIKINMNVIANNGLLGIVEEVGENYSKVRTLIDDKSYVAAVSRNSKDTLIVKGSLKDIDNGYIKLMNISKNSKLEEGDEIITSSSSSRYLPGITIGYVKKIINNKNDLTKTGNLSLAVDFSKLDMVLVIKEIKNDVSELEKFWSDK